MKNCYKLTINWPTTESELKPNADGEYISYSYHPSFESAAREADRCTQHGFANKGVYFPTSYTIEPMKEGEEEDPISPFINL